MRKLGFIKKSGFIIGVIVLLMAVVPMSDGLLVQAVEPEEDWYYKPGNWTDYALSGMPDFDQKQDNWTNPFTGNWSYCGPVAVANSLWWFDSSNEPSPVAPPTINDNYGLVTSYNPGGWDDHNVSNVEPLVNDLAYWMDTDGQRTGFTKSGTDVMDMQWGIDMYLLLTGYYGYYYEKTVLCPDFDWIEDEVERCEDVVLLLGFYQSSGGFYERIGGHYVTVAGVNSTGLRIGISDPYYDNAEAGGPGRVLPPGGHPAAGHNASVHNDTQYVSHDTYDVVQVFPMNMPPCWGLPNYAVGKNVLNFAGQNGGGTYNPQGPEVETIIDYAVAVSPKPDINDVIDSDYNWIEEQEGVNVTVRVHVTDEVIWNNTIYDMEILFWTDLYGTEWVKKMYFDPPLQYCQNYTFNVWYPFPPEIVVLHFSNYDDENIGFAFSYPEGALPDLQVVEKWETVEGCEYYVNYIVYNAGHAPAGASTTCIYADGDWVGDVDCPPLLPGEWDETTAGPYDCPGNTTVWIMVYADNYDDVAEEDEGNNYYENLMEQPLEFGDAPDPTYPSLLASDGSRHCPTDTELLGLGWFGQDCKDYEFDALVIDNDACCDGLVTTFLTSNDPAATVTFEVTNFITMDPLIVNILIDLNIDGDWNDAGEHVVQNQLIFLPGPAENTFVSNTFSTVGATPGPTWLRLTLTRTPVTVPWDGKGQFACGETEDWNITMEEGFYWKPGNWTDYAPSGMPDFDQKQDDWNFMGQWTYCGPVAVANSLWWFDSVNEPSPVAPPTINDNYDLVTAYGAWDDHDTQNVEPLVNDLASLMNTGPAGTDVMDMQQGIRDYLNATGYNDSYYEHTEIMPEFAWIEAEVERCQDVILLLGFWWFDGDWYRIGGHYVTVAGVNSNTSQIGISDPFLDNAELGFPGRVLPPVPPHPDPVHNAGVHNDTWYVSHDIYNVTPSESPGGFWKLEGYAEGMELDINYNFQGQNGECFGPPYEFGPIFTEIEYAVAVSPTNATLVGLVDFWRATPAPCSTHVTGLEVRFFDNSTENETGWSPINVTTDNQGNFTIGGIPPGTYDIGIKNWTCISKMNMSVTLNSTKVVDFGTPVEADCVYNDDMADGWDYAMVLNNYGALKIADPAGWAASEFWKADFNRDEMLDGWDYAAVLNNYGAFGEIFLYTH